MHNDQFHIVPVNQVGDSQLRRFATSTWGKDGWEEVKKAWWRDGTYAATIAAVETGSNTMAGLCVAVPSEWAMPDGRDVKAVSICGWYVSPAYMGNGLGKMLVRSFTVPSMNALSISDAAVENFAKMGWVGPFSSYLRLLPLPALRRRKKNPRFWVRSHEVSAGSMSTDLIAALDVIDVARPETVLRRKRRAHDWNAFLQMRPARRVQFHLLYDRERPVGYFVMRSTDQEAGRQYRLARLHYVSDVVLNSLQPELVGFAIDSMAAAAPATAGAVLLCTTSDTLAKAATVNGWMDEGTPGLGRRLARKAPRYMLAGQFAAIPSENFWLTFVDSDVDLNI